MVDEMGVNAIWIACLNGHAESMRILAERGIDMFKTDQSGLNLLHLAVRQNFFDIVKMLLESDYPIFQECNNGLTAF